MSLVVRKPVFGVSDLFRHKPGSTATEDRAVKGVTCSGYEKITSLSAFLI